MNVQAYLKDIDAEITKHRQDIAARQLRIQQLEDMRLLMLAREEYRAEFNGQVSPFGTLPYGVELAVRDIADEGVLSRARKEGLSPHQLMGPQKPLSKKRRKKAGPNAASQRERMRTKALRYLADLPPGEAAASPEMANFFGLPADQKERKPLQNALYSMRVTGLIAAAPSHGKIQPYAITEAGRAKLAEMSK